jgi:hypothetical protein
LRTTGNAAVTGGLASIKGLIVCGDPWLGPGRQIAGEHAMSNTILLPFQPD